jgi:hypothetical protein
MMRRLLAIAAVTVAALLIGSPVAPAHPPSNSGSVARATVWTAAWAESRQRPSASFAPNWSEQGFADQTVRQVVRVSVGGVATRVRLSNAYGSAPLKVAGATIARTTGGATVQQSSLQNLTVHHARAFTVPAGAALSTDLVPMRLSPGIGDHHALPRRLDRSSDVPRFRPGDELSSRGRSPS